MKCRVLLITTLIFAYSCNDPADQTPLQSKDAASPSTSDRGSSEPTLDAATIAQDAGSPVSGTDMGTSILDARSTPDAHLSMADAGPTGLDLGFADTSTADVAPLPVVEGAPCPAAWNTQELEENEDGTWEVMGNTDGSESVTEGSCGGGSGQHVYRFTTPSQGLYAIEVTGETFAQLGFATVYVRTSCPEVATELACDARRESRASVTIELPANQTVYVFVDGLRSGQFPSTGGYRLRVFRPDPPVIEQLAAWINPMTGSASIDVAGVSGTASPSGLQYRFLDANGAIVPSRGSVDPLRFGLIFEIMPQDGGPSTFMGTLDFASDVPVVRRVDVDQLEVAVYDFMDGISEVVRTRMLAPRELRVGERCDMVSARTVCPAETECFIQDPLVNPNPACHPMGEQCPGEWTVWDLNQQRTAAGHWVYEGTLLRANPPLEEHGRGTCPGSTGRNDLFSFTAPETTSYVFETSGEFGDTIMWIRNACGIIGHAAELGCNDDTPGLGRFSRIEVDLEADQTVYVFVDSFGAEERREYTLTVRPR